MQRPDPSRARALPGPNQWFHQQEFRDLLTVTWETAARPQESLVVEARHADIENGRWVFPLEEAKGDTWPRTICLTPKAVEVTERLMLEHPNGALFRNSDGTAWTTFAVNGAFIRLETTLGMKRLRRKGLNGLRRSHPRSSQPGGRRDEQ